MVTYTYTVLIAFMDVRGARHLVGEPIVDGSIIPPALISRGYVRINTVADPDAVTDARLDSIEASVLANTAADGLVDDRLEAVEEIVATIGA